MSHVRIEGLTKRFAGHPPTTAMDGLDLEVAQGEFLVLLGPSGCGKTTTLRCLAGLERPDAGRVVFDDRPVFDAASRLNLPPNKRNIGMVFQSYALWPHMTVRRNIGYPLRARKVRGAAAARQIEEAAALVDCTTLLDRYPAQLSGGQQQRVALARGLVAQPDVLLFDEPLSNLDARLRDLVRSQLHELHARLRFTAVFVTHDQSEAFALGDRLAIMRSGRFEQVDSPETIFEHPATEYVADFIGMSNRLGLTRVDDSWTSDGEPLRGRLPLTPDRTDVAVRLRPDDVLLARSGGHLPPGTVVAAGRVLDAAFGGRHVDVVVSVGGSRLSACVPIVATGGWAKLLRAGDEVAVGFDPASAAYFDAEGTTVEPVPAARPIEVVTP